VESGREEDERIVNLNQAYSIQKKEKRRREEAVQIFSIFCPATTGFAFSIRSRSNDL